MSDLQYWLALNLLSEIGPVSARRLLSAFGSPEQIFAATSRELMSVEGIGAHRAACITGFNGWDRIKEEVEKAENNNIRIVHYQDNAYPECLKQMYDAPLALYIKGSLADTDKYAIAMVGSRNATDYGMQTARTMGQRLASAGLAVVSGMARGIDTASHTGALEAGGRTIAVLGSGLDVPYPSSNRGLMEKIENSGAVISEFPLGTQPLRENFPRRNRIISALSLGVIVVEAALDSGSLITVRYALEQNKEVFAVPGNIISGNSRGTNALIKKGAKLIEVADEVLNDLSPQIKGILRDDRVKSRTLLQSINDDEQRVFNSLNNVPKHIDMITREIKMPSGKALSTLLHLELKGLVRQVGGSSYVQH